MHSIWQKQSFSFTTDIAIVGAGLTGLLTAIQLKKSAPSLSVRILEKGLFPEGASVKNAGFACFGSVSEILDDMANEGEDKAFNRVVERFTGLQLLFETIGKEDVELIKNGGVEVFTDSEKEILQQSLDSLSFINSRLRPALGFEPFGIGANQFGLNALSQTIQINGEGTLHSGKLIRLLLQKAIGMGVEINFGVDVKSIENASPRWLAHTGEGDFYCSKLLVATNGFTSKLLPALPILPARGQIVITSPVPGLKLDRSFHLHQGYFYFRNFQGRVLLGGGRHLDRSNETTTDQNVSPTILEALHELLKTVILPGKEFSIEQSWAGTMAFGPQNEKEAMVEETQENLYVAARLGGMGVAMSPLVANKCKNLILS